MKIEILKEGCFFFINKKKGLSSNDVIYKVKKYIRDKLNINTKGLKIGHSGTLDPMADGLLCVAFGNATRILECLSYQSKTYEFTIKWGANTDSHDITGKVTSESNKRVALYQLQKYIDNHIGSFMQVPPKFSACKINGERAYNIARAGGDFELSAKKIFVKRFEIISHSPEYSSFLIEVSSGTYVRSIVRDLCSFLGVNGSASSISRTELHSINLKDPFVLDDIVISENNMVTIYNLLKKNVKKSQILQLNDSYIDKLSNGMSIKFKCFDDKRDKFCFDKNNSLRAICTLKSDKKNNYILSPSKVLNTL